MANYKKDFSKYVISAFLLIAGIVPLVKYLQGDSLESQPLAMLFAGIALILVGIIALPEVLNKITSNTYKGLLLLGTLGSLGLLYSVITSVSDEIEFQETKRSVEKITIQRLKDIRETQLAHKSVYGTYAPDFDSLEHFINAVVMPVTYNMGSFHDTLNEESSLRMGYVIKRMDLDSLALVLDVDRDELYKDIEEDNSPYKIRDTTYTSFFAEHLTPSARAKSKLPSFSLHDMPFNPNTGERFKMKIGVVETGGLWQPTIYVQDPTPFGREKVKKDTLSFGSTAEAHTDGNWRN
ncbi:MAG: hypothetical protein COA49_09420 [Bacteroidetes bacterium]|nr:MAG: hypothetical protein COA49_09420 [Bacteroidota bacterium]